MHLSPFVAVHHGVDAPRLEDLKQLVPLALRKNRGHAQLGSEQTHQLNFETGNAARRVGIGIGVGPAPFHIAAIEKLPGFTHAFNTAGA